MRFFVGSCIFAGVLLGGFVIGITAQQTILMMGSFCLWTPAMVVMGYALAASGIRIQIGRDDYPRNPPPNGRPPASRPQRTAVVERDF